MSVKTSRRYTWQFYKELVLAGLAVLSVGFVFYEFIAQPDQATRQLINLFDIIVALIFLADFLWAWLHAKHKARFLSHNWYLLLASIPLLNSWAELLRGLRLLELVRLMRAGEHISYAVTQKRR